MKKKNFFWVSFSDLMTSLFFIMLVLFVVSIGYLQMEKKKAEGERIATEKQLKKIKELQTAVQQLPSEYFKYDDKYKRFKLKRRINFRTRSSIIKTTDTSYLNKVGKSINHLIETLNKKEEYKAFNIKYLIVIEGMASKDNYSRNFELSYERAYSLYKLWKSNGIVFDPLICDLQIAGSGTEGIREYFGREEKLNQQFLIHIIPKIGKVELIATEASN